MQRLINVLLGNLTGPMAGPLGRELLKHFAELDRAEGGLTRKTAEFIVDGSGASVLSTLATPKVARAWSNGFITYFASNTPVVRMMADGMDEALIRFGHVMAALQTPGHSGHWGRFGTALAPDWLTHTVSTTGPNGEPVCSMEQLRRLAELGGASAAAILDILCHPGPGVPYGTNNSFERFAGAGEWLAGNVEAVVEQQSQLDAHGRVELIAAIGRFGLVDAYLPLLMAYGISTAKTVRAAVGKALTGGSRDKVEQALAEAFDAARPAQRTELVNLALGALGTDATSLLERWREGETDKKPREAIERALASLGLAQQAQAEIAPGERGYIALDGTSVVLPPPAAPPAPSRIPDEALALLRPSIDSYNAMVRKVQEANRHERNHWSRSWQTLGSADIEQLRSSAEAPGSGARNLHRRAGIAAINWTDSFMKWDRSGVAAFYAHPAVTVRHLVAILHAETNWNFLALLGDRFGHVAAQELKRRLKTASEFQMAVDLWVALGHKPPALEYLETMWNASLDHVDRDLLWVHVAESFDALDEALALRPSSADRPLAVENALHLLATLPKVPHRYLLPLMGLATGTSKILRQHARALLAGAPDIDESIQDLLGDGKQEVRAGAAEWLAARGARGSVPALRKALAREKSDVARAAIITALEALGDDVSDCFDVKRLLDEARTGLAKTSAKDVDWFPFDLLPSLSWRGGKAVDPQIVRWWVVLASKLKQPGGNAWLDLWLDRLQPEDARRLGLFVLRSWIEQDTRRTGDDEANAYAQAHIDGLLQQNLRAVRQYPQYASYYVTDRDLLFAQLKRQKLDQYLGSATDSKGILALATKAEGADAAAAVRAFLKDHGARVSQAKALIDALAANPSPAAIQIVLATANRFKARTVQEHAAALIERIAERRGWSPQELADRTIPTAGLDESGEAELDCGEGRSWRLALDPADALVLLNPSGQPAKALPAPRSEEEKPLIAAAKKLVATARKELKQVVAVQTERLHEAMCLERQWPAEDWRRDLLLHPIVGRLLRRLVWTALDPEGGVVTLFRPLDDGTFTDSADGEVTLDGIASVRIAHSSLVSADEAQAWRTHLADYEIEPLFDQFDSDLPTLSESAATDTTIDDRRGWMIESFKLRGTATRLGYVRGAAEDGGVFTTYERRYDSAGLVAVIEFTGSPLPEENIAAALQDLRFARARRGSGWHGSGVPLGEVPPVLLAETWKDLHRIAAAGTGFDPDWEKKTGW